MLEGLVAWVLNNYLGKYVENLNTDQLSVALLSGKVELENLPLKKDALRHLGLPVEVRAGFIGKVQLQVPVRQIRSAPWVIAIEKLYLVAAPVNLDEWDPDVESLIAHERKVALLDALEAGWRARTEAADASYYATSYSSWLSYGTGLLANIVENLQLKLNDVHIRFEDGITCAPSVFACGLTVEALAAESCDAEWRRGVALLPPADPDGCSFKILELQKLAVYWDPITSPNDLLANCSISELRERMTQTWLVSHRYMLEPASATARVRRERTAQPLRSRTRPRLSAHLTLNTVALNLNSRQYSEIVGCALGLEQIAKLREFRELRPAVPVRGHARDWWIYALKCHTPNTQFTEPQPSWESCALAARQAREYVETCLFALSNPAATLPAAANIAKDQYEWKTPLHTLKALREVAMRKVPKATPVATPDNPASSGRSMLVHWFPQWWGWYGQPPADQSEAAPPPAPPPAAPPDLEEEILDVLADSLENNTLLKRDTVFGKFEFVLSKGCLNLSTETEESETLNESTDSTGSVGVGSVGVELQFSAVCVRVESRPRASSLLVAVSLGSVALRERVTPATLFPVLVAPMGMIRENLSAMNPSAATLSWCRAQTASPAPPAVAAATAPAAPAAAEPLFQLTYEKKPFGLNCDYKLFVKSQSLEVVWCAAAARWALGFARGAWGAAWARPRLAYASVRDSTKQRLITHIEHMMHPHPGDRRSWQVELDISAPQILFVEDLCDRDASVLVVDFGRLRLANTSVADTSTAAEDEELFMTPCSTPPASLLSPADPPLHPAAHAPLDAHNLHTRLYDRYKIELSDLQILVGRARDNWKYAHTKTTSSLHLLDRFSISLQAERRVVHTSDPQYPTATLCGSLPALVVHLSEQKLLAVRSVIASSALLPDTSKDQPSQGQPHAEEEEESSVSSETEKSEHSSHHHATLFMLQFAIDQMSLEVQSRGRSIAEVQVCGVKAAMTARPCDLSLSLSVHSLLLVDALQTYGPDFELLVASHKHVGMDTASGSIRGSEPTSPTSPTSPASPTGAPHAHPHAHPHALQHALHSLRRDTTTPTEIKIDNLFWTVIPDMDRTSPAPSWATGASFNINSTTPGAIWGNHGAMWGPSGPMWQPPGPPGGYNTGGWGAAGLVDSEALIAVELCIVKGEGDSEDLRIANILFNNLDIIANQETIVELIGFTQRVLGTKSAPKKVPSDAAFESKIAVTPQTAPEAEEFKKETRTEITFDFHRLGVLLLRAAMLDGNVVAKKIATATLSEAKIQATIDGTQISMGGSLGGVQVVSLCEGAGVHSRVLSAGRALQPATAAHQDDDKALLFTIERTVRSPADAAAPAVEVRVSMHVASVWYTHSGPLLRELQSCLTEFKQYLANLARSIRAAAADMAIGLVHPRGESLYANPKLSQSMEGVSPRRRTVSVGYSMDDPPDLASDNIVLSISIELESPVVVVPRAAHSTQVFVAHLGRMSLGNRPGHGNTAYRVRVRDISLATLDVAEMLKTHQLTSENMEEIYDVSRGKPVLHNTALQVSVNYCAGDDDMESKLCEVSGKIVGGLHVSARREQYEQLLETIRWVSSTGDSTDSKHTSAQAAHQPANQPSPLVEPAVPTLRLDPQLRAAVLAVPPPHPPRAHPQTHTNTPLKVVFELPTFTLELRADLGAGERSLVELAFREFTVRYQHLHRHETLLQVSLHSVTMEDLTKDPESKHRLLMQSHTPQVPPKAVFVSKSCPDFVTEYPADDLASVSSLQHMKSNSYSLPSKLNVTDQQAKRNKRDSKCGVTPPCSPTAGADEDERSELSPDDNLVWVSVHTRHHQHPLFVDKYNRVSKLTKVDFNCLNLVVNIDSWVAVLDFFGVANDEPDGAPGDGPQPQETDTHNTVAEHGITQMETSIRSLSVVVVTSRGEACRALVSRVGVVGRADASIHTRRITGSLGALVLTDLTPHSPLWRDRFRTQPDNALTFDYQRLSVAEAASAGHETSLTIEMGPVTYVHTKRFVGELQAFARDFSLLRKVILQARLKVSVRANAELGPARTNRTLMRIRCQTPVIVLPVSGRARAALLAELHHLQLDNCFKYAGDADTYSTRTDPTLNVRELVDARRVQLEGLSLWCARGGRGLRVRRLGPALLPAPAQLTLHIEHNMSGSHNVPDMTIQGTLTTLQCALDPSQYKLVRGVLAHNLGECVHDLLPPVPPTVSTDQVTIQGTLTTLQCALDPSQYKLVRGVLAHNLGECVHDLLPPVPPTVSTDQVTIQATLTTLQCALDPSQYKLVRGVLAHNLGECVHDLLPPVPPTVSTDQVTIQGTLTTLQCALDPSQYKLVRGVLAHNLEECVHDLLPPVPPTVPTDQVTIQGTLTTLQCALDPSQYKLVRGVLAHNLGECVHDLLPPVPPTVPTDQVTIQGTLTTLQCALDPSQYKLVRGVLAHNLGECVHDLLPPVPPTVSTDQVTIQGTLTTLQCALDSSQYKLVRGVLAHNLGECVHDLLPPVPPTVSTDQVTIQGTLTTLQCALDPSQYKLVRGVLAHNLGECVHDLLPPVPPTVSTDQVTIQGTLTTLQCALDPSQYKLVRGVLAHNLGECVHDLLPPVPPTVSTDQVTIQGTLTTLQCALDPSQYKLVRGVLAHNLGECVHDLLPPVPPTVPTDQVWTTTSLKLDLHDVTMKLEPEHGVSSLACINFIKSRLLVETYSDLSQDIDLVSQEILVSDTRYAGEPANRRGNVFSHIVTPMPDHPHTVQAEVHARKRRESSAYTILVNNMRLMAILDWWEAAHQFLMQQPPPPADPDQPPLEDVFAASRGLNLQPPDVEDPLQMELKLNVTDSQVVLVEDASVWDTNAVILKSTTVITYKAADALKPVSCELNELEVFSCVLGLEEETALSIVDPAALHIVLNKDHVLQIDMGTLNLRLSYHDMRMFAAMLQSLPVQARAALSGKGDSEAASAPANSEHMRPRSAPRLYTPKWARRVPPVAPPPPQRSSVFPLRAVQVNAECVTLCVIDDCLDSDVPLLEVSLSELQVEQDLRKVEEAFEDPLLVQTPSGAAGTIASPKRAGAGGGRLSGVLSADYYNRTLSGWEPVIEPWRFETTWENTLTSGLSLGRVQTEIVSQDILNTNVTSSLIELCQLVRANWTADYYAPGSAAGGADHSPKGSPAGHRRRSPFVPYALRNHTGHRLWFTTLLTTSDVLYESSATAGAWCGPDDSWVLVRAGETEPFSFGARRARTRAGEGGGGKGAGHPSGHAPAPLHRLALRLDGWAPPDPVCVDRVGVYFRHLTHTKTGAEARIVFEVSLEGSARKLVTVRSALQLVNTLPHPVEVRVDHANNTAQWTGSSRSATVAAGAAWSAPLGAGAAALWARPIVRNALPAAPAPLDWRTAPALLHAECRAPPDTSYRFCCVVIRERFPPDRGVAIAGHTLTLVPALRLENLLPLELQYRASAPDDTSMPRAAGTLPPADTKPFHEVNVEEGVEISVKLEGFGWSSPLSVGGAGSANSFSARLKLRDSRGRRLYLNARVTIKKTDGIKVSISAAYWLVNRTGLPLVFRAEGAAGEAAGQFEEHEVARMVAPLLFSFAEADGGPTVSARLGRGVAANPEWCSPFGLGPGVGTKRLEARGEAERVYAVGVCARAGRGRYRHTNIVTLAPRYQLHNNTSHRLQFAQRCTATTLNDPGAIATHVSAVSGCYLPWHWARWEREQLLCVRILTPPGNDHCSAAQLPRTGWSGGFRIDAPRTLHVACREVGGAAYEFVRVEVVLQGCTLFVVLSDAECAPEPLRIDNYSAVAIMFHQVGCAEECVVGAHASVRWALPEPEGAAALALRAPGGPRTTLPLDTLPSAHHLLYQNFIYVVFTATQSRDGMVAGGGKAGAGGAAEGDGGLVLEVPLNSTRVVLGRKRYGDRSQLWRRGPNDQLIHEGSSPPQPTDALLSDDSALTPHSMVLDIEDSAPRPGRASALVLRRADPRRASTQAWRLLPPARMACAHANLCVQPDGGLMALTPGSRVVLGLPESRSGGTMLHGVPAEQAVAWQTLRPGSGRLDVSLTADGPTKLLRIHDHKEPDSGWIEGEDEHEKEVGGAGREWGVRVSFAGVSVSLVSRAPPAELVHARLAGLQLELAGAQHSPAPAPATARLALTLTHMQWDNQLLGTPSPVLLYCLPDRSGTAMPALHAVAELMRTPANRYNAYFFRHLVVALRPLAVRLEERLMLKLWAWAAPPDEESAHEAADESEYEARRVLDELTSLHATRVYCALIKIIPSQIRLSMCTANKLEPGLATLKKRLGLTLIRFEDASVELEPFVRAHPFDTPASLARQLLQHFRDELKWQAAKILGSVDFLGNPLGFVADVSEGVSGFFLEGNVSALLKNVTHGISNSAAKVTESLGDGLERVVGDEAHEETRRRIRSAAAGAHIAAGFRGLGLGILGGMTSLVKHSYEGATQEGIPGFLAGVGKGLVGTVTKPVIGVLDLAAETASALRDTSKRSDKWVPGRVRAPRCAVGAGGLLPRYCAAQAAGAALLYALNGNDYSEQFLAYRTVRDTPHDIRALLSTTYIRICTCKHHQPQIVMETHLSNLVSCVAVSSEGAHYVELGVRGGGAGGGGGAEGGREAVRRPRVQCDSSELAAWVAKHAAYARQLYHEQIHTLLPSDQ
ncbi:hypothetical protein O0L34_g6723 [Tuta absoluta]|nr:hypothetical protein O0L34_g6723 [Tuta absoluta]